MKIEVEGHQVAISNPDKFLYPEAKLTKWDYILVLGRLAPYLLPYCKNRYLTTIRYPDGVNGDYFYQKNVPQPKPEWVETSWLGDTQYVLLNNLPTLIWLGNLACLEFHVSFDQATKPDYPTELVFDLDPTVPDFDKVIQVALHTREAIQELGMDGVVKTSGASGLQIYVPIEPRYPFSETRKVSRFLAFYLAERYPDLITLERKVSDRGEQVYFDYLQHWRNKTLIAPYSPRATREATLSTPLQWEELVSGLKPTDFDLHTIQSRLRRDENRFLSISSEQRYHLDEVLKVLK